MGKPGRKTAQAIMEYVLVFSVVMAAILASGFIDRVRGTFDSYFTKAVEHLR